MADSANSILLVDDEPALLKLIRAYLERRGYAVTAAETIDDAWSAMEAAPRAFDVVVLDATMAGQDFVDFALGMLQVGARIRLLVTSGYPVDISAVTEAAGDRAEFLQKPFSPQMLAEAVRRMLAPQKEGL